MGRKKENPVYAYFSIDTEKNVGTCQINSCGTNVKFPISGNLEKHLKRHHPLEFEDLMRRKEMIASFVSQRNSSDISATAMTNGSYMQVFECSPLREAPIQERGCSPGPASPSVKTEFEANNFHHQMPVSIEDGIVNGEVTMRDPRFEGPRTYSTEFEEMESEERNSVGSLRNACQRPWNSPSNETDQAFCDYLCKEFGHIKDPIKKRSLKLLFVSEILKAQD